MAESEFIDTKSDIKACIKEALSEHADEEQAVYTPQDNVALTASGGATPSDTSPAFAVFGADTLALTVKNGASTNLDAVVQSSWDGTSWDTEPLHSLNLGANKQKTIPLTGGPKYMRVYVENKDAANATTVTTKLTMAAD